MKSRCIFNKFSAFIGQHKLISILVCALLAAAMLTTVILLVGGDSPTNEPGAKPTPNPVTNGAAEKVYYYDLPGGTTTLTLLNGYNFIMVGPELHKSGEYFFTDDKITLDFVRNSDGAASAVLDGSKLTVVWKEATLTFREKIDYTVSFNTNGGSKIDSVIVTNGKTLTAPSTVPQKDGYTFEGWYTDEALTKSFSFGITLITDDTVLYAKWTKLTP